MVSGATPFFTGSGVTLDIAGEERLSMGRVMGFGPRTEGKNEGPTVAKKKRANPMRAATTFFSELCYTYRQTSRDCKLWMM